MKVEESPDTAHKREVATTRPKMKVPAKPVSGPGAGNYQLQTFRQPIGAYPGMYTLQSPGGGAPDHTRHTSYPAPAPALATTPLPAQLPMAVYTPAPVYTPPPSISPRLQAAAPPQQHPAPAPPPLTSFYPDWGRQWAGAGLGVAQHPVPYQPAITFLDTALQQPSTATARSSFVHTSNFPQMQQQQHQQQQHHQLHQQQQQQLQHQQQQHQQHQQKQQQQQQPELQQHQVPGPTPRPGQGSLGTPQPSSLHHEAGPQHYDPFSFSQQQQAAQPRNIEAGGGDRARDLAPIFGPAPAPVLKHPRPADTKYSPAADPRTFFDNQFHASDRFFEMGQDFDKFQVETTAANTRAQPADTRTHKERKSDLSKERRNLKYNRTKETEKMRSLRSKLFDNREPGGYYIKVFNNDGNNYSIRDGNFHQSERSPPPPPPPPPSPSPSPARRTGGGPGQLWPDQTEFESREVSQHFPFLF